MGQGPIPSPDWSRGELLAALGLPADAASGAGLPARVAGLTSDSRRAAAGLVFVALPGERVDGHDFVRAAAQAGAAGAIVAAPRADGLAAELAAAGRAGFPLLAVPDSLAAYRACAGAWRARFTGPVVAVAGAVGKTTTKELLAAALAVARGPVLRTEGSFNGFVGIPMTLLRLRPGEHRAAVIEIGIDEPGAMLQHLELVRPTHALVTAVEPEHLEKLRDLATVAREECEALRWTHARGGSVAIRADDPWVARESSGIPDGPRAIRYALTGAATLSGAHVPAARAGDPDRLRLADGAEFALPLPGAHNALNLTAALAVARLLGVGDAEAADGLTTFRAPEGRSVIRAHAASGATVICDWYNASPSSMRAGLALLAGERRLRGGRAFAALGDMLELGEGERALHEGLAPDVRAGADRVLLFGPRMRWLAEALGAGRADWFATHAELAAALAGELRAGDVLLLKGSRGMRMEECWKLLQPTSP